MVGADISMSKVQKIMKDSEARCAVVNGVTKSRTQFKD